ncbi:pentapeptide repeat-containing protein [Synechococcus sp. BSF8S]|uniref:pentapeptide repeat-containing protein n=1 Tax=Synechococcales TaxID=1890424 RepID=UPI00162811F2|nr:MULTISPECIES: pentapeptide repeat-containing protein [unclassified Synechococcus]MBC1259874.1 pentapeptide repeat-containing protein [Synechococcus sp. BSF8S]MBC1262703.1 pentapeptide repeat-containing protein [Synechococcus sp. BSA11S]
MAPSLRTHRPLLRGALLLATSTQLTSGAVQAADANDVMRLLDQRACSSCRLQDADLVHADLRDADLSKAQLQRANLSRAQLDGANLQGADLTFTSLLGASLRGADLRGAQLEGTDLRESDLSGALLDVDGLARSHWKQAVGVNPSASSYADLHNSGVEAALQGQASEAETYFNQAILKQPDAALSWLARGISRAEQAKRDLAAADFTYAASLFEKQGNTKVAQQVRQGAEDLKKNPQGNSAGNGWGGQFLQSATAIFQQLAPLAVKYFAPLAF